MSSKLKNITFSLPEDIIDKFKVYVQDKDIPSLNAAVREALEEYSVKIEKKKLKKEMEEAANDPLFIKDIKDSMEAFETSDNEASGGADKW